MSKGVFLLDCFLDILGDVVAWMHQPFSLGAKYTTSFWEVIVFGVVGGITIGVIGEIINGFD